MMNDISGERGRVGVKNSAETLCSENSAMVALHHSNACNGSESAAAADRSGVFRKDEVSLGWCWCHL